jgi:hypothetical protein
MHLNTHVTLQAFDKWSMNFVGLINPHARRSGERYIITVTEYLKIWEYETLVLDYTRDIATQFPFENVVTLFGCSRVLLGDHGTHFLNKKIPVLTEEFQIHHQVNGIVESFNKILENAFTKICNVGRDDWDLRVPTVLWAYRMTSKNLIGQTPFRLVYGKEVVMPMEFILPIFHIVVITDLSDSGTIEERLSQFVQLEED